MKCYLESLRQTERFLVLSIHKAEEGWLVAMEKEYAMYHRDTHMSFRSMLTNY